MLKIATSNAMRPETHCFCFHTPLYTSPLGKGYVAVEKKIKTLIWAHFPAFSVAIFNKRGGMPTSWPYTSKPVYLKTALASQNGPCFGISTFLQTLNCFKLTFTSYAFY
ncbi:MAG: hypothetical protein ACOCZ8_02530 [Bacteroidota bacterium]